MRSEQARHLPEQYTAHMIHSLAVADGMPVPIALREEDGFKLTKELLLGAITDKTKILVMPFPNNPTGAIMTKEDLEEIVDVIIEKDLF